MTTWSRAATLAAIAALAVAAGQGAGAARGAARPADVAETLPEPVHRVLPGIGDGPDLSRVRVEVLVSVQVRADGGVGGVRVLRSVPGLDSVAVAAARRWRFRPATSGGRAAPVRVAIPFEFGVTPAPRRRPAGERGSI